MALLHSLRHSSSDTLSAPLAGIALIYLQLVDSVNEPKTLLDCPRPAPEAWKSLGSDMFSK